MCAAMRAVYDPPVTLDSSCVVTQRLTSGSSVFFLFYLQATTFVMGFAPRLAGLARLSIRSPCIVRFSVSCCPCTSAAIGLAPAVTASRPRRLHVFGTGGAESAGAGSGHWYSSRTARLIGFVGVSVVTPLFGEQMRHTCLSDPFRDDPKYIFRRHIRDNHKIPLGP